MARGQLLGRVQTRRFGHRNFVNALVAPVLDWDDNTASATPSYLVSLTLPLVGDVITLNRYSDAGRTTLTDTASRALVLGDITGGAIPITIGAQPDGVSYDQVEHSRTGYTSGLSNVETVTISTGGAAATFLLMAA